MISITADGPSRRRVPGHTHPRDQHDGAALGLVHLVFTALDMRTPRRFAPADPKLLPAMRATRIRLRRDVRNFWQSYIGFHVSHSVGLLMFSGMFLALSFQAPALIFSTVFCTLLIGGGLIYAILSHLFWFSVPFWGSVAATAMFVTGALVHAN